MTDTVLVLPSAISKTMHFVPSGIPVNIWEVGPAGALAGITIGGVWLNGTPLQNTPMVTAPCWPAAGPAMVLVTVREPTNAT